MDKLVSICLATYNGEKYLKEQLDSIINQTYKNINLIVQDDCSSDKTLEIIDSYSDKLDIKIYKNETNLGYIKNFESLIQKADGDFIAICDQDDIWDRDKISSLIDNIKDSILIYSNSLLIDENSKSLSKTLSSKLKNNFINSNTAINFLYDNSVSAHAILFKKELLPYIALFPNTLYFDSFIAATAASLNKIYFIDKNFVKYRQHSKNTLGNKKSNNQNLKSKVLNKLDKKNEAVANMLIKIQEMMKIQTLNIEEKDILKQLNNYYLEYENRYFNLNMFLFLLKNKDTFFAITTKNRFLLSLKKSIGKKLYKLVPIL